MKTTLKIQAFTALKVSYCVVVASVFLLNAFVRGFLSMSHYFFKEVPLELVLKGTI